MLNGIVHLDNRKKMENRNPLKHGHLIGVFLWPLSLLVIGIIILESPIHVSAENIDRASYGEPCSSMIRCSSKSWLACVNNTCTCAQPQTMIYNSQLETCVSNSGERCKFELMGMAVVETIGCVENAECSEHGICSCAPGYFETLNRTCSPEKTFGDDCSLVNKCSSKLCNALSNTHYARCHKKSFKIKGI